jgi:D-glycero-D-manno-heptose 1,7-bisphosphate phosphatase
MILPRDDWMKPYFEHGAPTSSAKLLSDAIDRIKRVPVLYTDIDGTIRHGKDEIGRFVNTAEDVTVFDGVPDLLWGYKNLGWRIIGISNQAGIGLGHMTMSDCFAAMGETQRQCRMAFDKIVFCAHRPYDDCPCRKPKTGMIMNSRQWLFQKFGEAYPMYMGLFVGDRPEDEACAANAGLPFVPADVWRTGEHLKKLQSGET